MKTTLKILTIIVLILLFTLLYRWLANRRQRNSFFLTGGIPLKTEIENNNKFFLNIVENAPQPRALMTDDFPYILNEKSGKWYYTEKTDGERAVLILNNGKAYKAKFGKITPLDFTVAFKGSCVLDSELYDGK